MCRVGFMFLAFLHRLFLRRVVALATVISVLAAGPAVAGVNDPDPLGLLLGGGATESLSLGHDVTTVWVCETDTGEDISTFTLAEVVEWANDEIAPYFSLISRGRYTVTFVAGGTLVAKNPDDCLDVATSATTTSNVMVIDRTLEENEDPAGFASSGIYLYGYNGVITGDLSTPASSSGRGFWISGTEFGRPDTPAHELGHTLGWPHSGSVTDENESESNPASPYDNLYDLMSGSAYNPSSPDINGNGCSGLGRLGPCHITHTIAINRYASGWIDANQIEIVARAGFSADLAGPESTGKQMALIPTANPLIYLTVEARPNTGYDMHLPYGGVVVHAVDLTSYCDGICWGTARRQYPAVSAIENDNHVIEVGESLLLAGVTISVTAATSTGYSVAFTGSPDGCAMGPNPFIDVPPTSFAYSNVGCIRTLGVTTGTSSSTYSPADFVTREQMAAFLGRLWRASGRTCSSAATPFTDLSPTSFATADVACIYDLGVTTGTGSSTYSPADFVTREQMAAFLGRLWRASGRTCSSAATPFTDLSPTSFATVDVACIYDLGVTTGTGSSTYSPADFVTREQMAAFLGRLWIAAT